jgi:hypothetical protein
MKNLIVNSFTSSPVRSILLYRAALEAQMPNWFLRWGVYHEKSCR